jgi:hypothetical protein
MLPWIDKGIIPIIGLNTPKFNEAITFIGAGAKSPYF